MALEYLPPMESSEGWFVKVVFNKDPTETLRVEISERFYTAHQVGDLIIVHYGHSRVFKTPIAFVVEE